jgi:sulfonate transport system permease protein
MTAPTITAPPGDGDGDVLGVMEDRVVPPSERATWYGGRHHRLLSWLAPLAFLVLWELLSRTKVLPPQVLPAPSKVFGTAQKLQARGELWHHVLVSLQRVLVGFTVGTTIGLALGVLVGLFRLADALFDRTLQMIRAIPFLALTPLVIVWFGVGESGKVFLVALGVTFPVYLNTVLGIRQVDPKLVEMSRVVGLNRARLVRDTVLPGALPSILNGVRLGLTTSWLALVIAETLGASAGIGFLSNNAREFLQTDIQVLVIIIYAAIGVVADLIARVLERRMLAWHPNYRNGR